MKNKFVTFFLLTLAAVYITASYYINKGDFSQSELPYYNYLLSALYHKRLNVTPFLSAVDLTFYEGKWYMYWGPAPALFVMPFFAFFKTAASDVVYTLIAGVANIFLFFFTAREFKKAFNIESNLFDILFITANFALVSPNFYLSLSGQVWHTNQVVATLYLLFFLVFYLKFWQKRNRYFFLLLAVVFINLAVLSRYTLIFYFSLFIPLVLQKERLKVLKILLPMSFFFVGVFFIYNYARFGNIFETGTSFQDIRSSEHVFLPAATRTSLIGTKYIRHNFETYFLSPLKLGNVFPFLEIDKEGNSMFMVYPLLLLAPLLFSTKIRQFKKSRIFLATALFGVILPILTYLMLFLGTGWAQWGLRYLLDAVPLVFILLLFVAHLVPRPVKILMLTYGVFVNIAGAILFYTTPL